jgi:hypothetical protein
MIARDRPRLRRVAATALAAVLTLVASACLNHPERTKLQEAAARGDVDVVRELLDAGADPNVADDDGWTALHLAANGGHTEVVEELLEDGADVSMPTADDQTPLELAVTGGHAPTAVALLRAGAQPEASLADSGSALEIALHNSNRILIGILRMAVEGPEWAISTRATDARMARRPPPAGATLLPSRVEPLGIAVDTRDGRLYWAGYRAGRIRSMRLDGSELQTRRRELPGPIGVAVDERQRRLYWTEDDGFPRRVRVATIGHEDTRTIVSGDSVNRPRAIALDPARSELLWTEAVSGRILRMGTDDDEPREIFTSGISSVADRPDHHAMRALGLTVAANDGRLYWSEITSSRIRSAASDIPRGADEVAPQDFAGADHGVDFPTGVVVDSDNGLLYWADAGRSAILRSPLDHPAPEVVVDADDGLVAPYGLALHEGTLFWTDAARDVIGRADVDGSDVQEKSLHDEEPFVAVTPDADCEAVLRRYLAESVHGAALCLDKVDAIKAVKRDHGDAADAVPTCIAVMARRDRARTVLAARLEACRPDRGGEIGADAAALLSVCATVASSRAAEPARRAGDSGAPDWNLCVTEALDRLVADEVARRFERPLEWIEEVAPFVADRERRSPQGSDSATRALDDLYDAVASALGQPTRQPGWLGTGQLKSWQAITSDAGLSQVRDDAMQAAGHPAIFRDNADGTVTDRRTGLMWEKKCDGCGGLHDVRHDYRWSGADRGPTVWDWLAEVNREHGTGFAGYSDWRLPNLKELQSIVDYERFNPAVGPTLDAALCGLGCDDLAEAACSCTAMSTYWTSTSFVVDPSMAFTVAFHLGLVGERSKEAFAFVRAVRAGATPAP